MFPLSAALRHGLLTLAPQVIAALVDPDAAMPEDPLPDAALPDEVLPLLPQVALEEWDGWLLEQEAEVGQENDLGAMFHEFGDHAYMVVE